MVENTEFVSPNAFLPFVFEDDARGIVSTAVIDYVSLAPLTNDDPISRVNDIIGMIERRSLRNDGAALARFFSSATIESATFLFRCGTPSMKMPLGRLQTASQD
jgi:hypothetical protein